MYLSANLRDSMHCTFCSFFEHSEYGLRNLWAAHGRMVSCLLHGWSEWRTIRSPDTRVVMGSPSAIWFNPSRVVSHSDAFWPESLEPSKISSRWEVVGHEKKKVITLKAVQIIRIFRDLRQVIR